MVGCCGMGIGVFIQTITSVCFMTTILRVLGQCQDAGAVVGVLEKTV